MRALLLLATLGLTGCVASAGAPGPVPYIDAHSHLLDHMDPEAEIALFREQGLAGVAIMHPDAPALTAVARSNPGYVTPFISLARLPEMKGLRLSAETAGAMAALADRGEACGFGEIPTRIVPRTEPSDDLSLLNPDRMRIYAAANARRLPIVLHVDIADSAVEASVARIAREFPAASLVLAHAGWSAAPEAIERLMAAHGNVHADLSVRLDPAGGLPADPLPPGSLPPGAVSIISILQADGQIRPGWQRVIQRFPDRFLFAMDVTQQQRPKYIGLLLATARKALAPLGRPAEHAIAHGNFERLVRGCTAKSQPLENGKE